MKQSARIFHFVGLLSLLTAIALTISPDQLGKSDVEKPHELSPIAARQLAVYRLFFKEEAVGRLSLEMIPQGNGSTLVMVQNEMKLVAFGQPINFELKLNAQLNDEQQLMSTTFEFASEGFVIQGTGRVMQNTLGLDLKVGDIEKKLRIPFDQRTTLSALWHEKEAVKKMKPGDVLELKLFDPVTQEVRPSKVRALGYEVIDVEGQSEKGLKVQQETMGLTLNGWLDEHGQIIRQELGLGLIAQKVQADFEYTPTALKGVDVWRSVSITPIRMNPEVLKSQKASYVFDGVSEEHRLDDHRQSWLDNRVTISREDETLDFPLPAQAPQLADSIKNEQGPTSRVRMIAQEIAKKSANTHEMLGAMLVWFKENIKTEANIKPNDIDLLLTTGKGDCLSQATLMVGLVKSLGLNASVVTGLAYHVNINRFVYHSWVIVEQEDQMVAVDPSWHQIPADTTHIAFHKGESMKDNPLWSLMNRSITISVVEYVR